MSVITCPVIDGAKHWRTVDFISDLHLSAQTPLTFEAWARYLAQTPAQAVFILGDLFEVWIGDDAALCRPQSFEATCASVLQQATLRLSLWFLPGNRDFLVGDNFLGQCGIRRLEDPSVIHVLDRSIVATHGDAWCLEDREYQAFRTQVRSAGWQADFLARPLETRQALARQMRDASEARKAGMPDPSLWADVDPAESERWLRATSSSDLVHGHTHRPGTTEIADGLIRHVLSDWDMDGTVQRAEVLRLSPEGWQRVALA